MARPTRLPGCHWSTRPVSFGDGHWSSTTSGTQATHRDFATPPRDAGPCAASVANRPNRGDFGRCSTRSAWPSAARRARPTTTDTPSGTARANARPSAPAGRIGRSPGAWRRARGTGGSTPRAGRGTPLPRPEIAPDSRPDRSDRAAAEPLQRRMGIGHRGRLGRRHEDRAIGGLGQRGDRRAEPAAGVDQEEVGVAPRSPPSRPRAAEGPRPAGRPSSACRAPRPGCGRRAARSGSRRPAAGRRPARRRGRNAGVTPQSRSRFARPKSASTSVTFLPRAPSASARFRARFDVPTPPLPLVKTSEQARGRAARPPIGDRGDESASSVRPGRA